MLPYKLPHNSSSDASAAWWNSFVDVLASHGSSQTAVALSVPWVLALLWGIYYWLVKRPAKADVEQMAPFVAFYSELTAGATPGFDQKFMKLFHPALLKEGGGVERGLIRAMARCTKAQFGSMTHISRETIAIKRVGMQVTGVALVDFEKAKGVRCKLSWMSRLPSVKRVRLETEGASPFSAVSGIRRADLSGFHVTAFNVEPRARDTLDVLRYLEPSEFESVADAFVDRLFAKPPSAAVAMMVAPLREKYSDAEKLSQLQASVANIVDSCGGLKDADIDATLLSCELKTKQDNASCVDGQSKSTLTEIDGVDFDYHVRGRVRHLQVHVRLVFHALRCWVGQYQIRVLPDERTQVVVDTETGESTVV